MTRWMLRTLGSCALCAALLTPPLTGVATAQAPAAVSSHDVLFVMDAAMSNLAEIQLAQLALEQSTDEDVRAFAQDMVTDHSSSLADLVTRAQAAGIAMPDNLTNGIPTLPPNDTADRSGGAFDVTYMKGQVLAHQRTIALYAAEAKNGGDADLQAYATQTLPTLMEHLQEAKQALRRVKKGSSQNQ